MLITRGFGHTFDKSLDGDGVKIDLEFEESDFEIAIDLEADFE